MAQITNTHKTSHQYIGNVNGKTFVVPHGKLDIYSDNYYKGHSDETITSRDHVKKHNPGFSDEEIDAVHNHVKSTHKTNLEEYALRGVARSFKDGKWDHQEREFQMHGTNRKHALEKAIKKMKKDFPTHNEHEVEVIGEETKKHVTASGEVDHAKVEKQYKRNETQNNHMANVVLLAKHYGTEDDHTTAQKHLEDGKKAGYNVHYADNSNLHMKLIDKMRTAQGKKPMNLRPIEEMNSVFDKHQINIAKKTLKMHPTAAAVLGGPDHEESRKILKKHGWSDEQIKKHELSEEKKFDIYHKGEYHVSTTQSKTAKEAKEKYLKAYPKHDAMDVNVHLSEDSQLEESPEHEWHHELSSTSKPLPGHAYHQSSDTELHNIHTHHSKKAVEKIRTDPAQAKKHQEYADNAKQILNYRKKTVSEGDQLNELNKTTLGSYIKKALPELRKHEFDVGSNSMGAGMSRIANDENHAKTYTSIRDSAKNSSNKRTKGITMATNKLMKEDVLKVVKDLIHEAAFTRRHFRQVADIIKNHPDEKKRHEMASHHAEIFTKSNPRFDKKRFFDAAGVKDHMNEESGELTETSSAEIYGHRLKSKRGVKTHETGDGKRHFSEKDAIAHADRIHKSTGNIISVEKLDKKV